MTQTFKDALKQELEAAGLSQPKAAELIGISQSVLSQYMTGKRLAPSLETLAKLIAAFPKLLFWLMRFLASEATHDNRR